MIKVFRKFKHPLTSQRTVYFLGQKLFSYTPKKKQVPQSTAREWREKAHEKICVIGDSHVGFFSGTEGIHFSELAYKVNISPDILPHFATLHLGPALAFSLAKYGSHTLAREKVDILIDTGLIRQGDHLLCSFGEIDLRVHALKQVELQKRSVEEVLSRIVTNYSDFLLYLDNKGFKCSVWAPIASGELFCEELPFCGSVVERNKATELFIKQLENALKHSQIKVFSIFSLLINQDYSTKLEYLSDGCHLNQKAWELVHTKYPNFLQDLQSFDQ